jgi:hypothetical protein
MVIHSFCYEINEIDFGYAVDFATFFTAKKVAILRPAIPQPCTAAQHPNASRSKNSHLRVAFFLAYWFAFFTRSSSFFRSVGEHAYCVFKFCFFRLLLREESCYCLKQIVLAAQTI